MEKAQGRLTVKGFTGIVVFFVLTFPGHLGAAILYGTGAHEKSFLITLSETENHPAGWDTLNEDVLGIFLAPTNVATGEVVTPEVLILPCVQGGRCVTVTAKDDAPVKGLLSFLHPTHTLLIDGESADALTYAVHTSCVQKKKGSPTPYKILREVVYEEDSVRSSFVGTCVLNDASSHSKETLLSFSVRGTIEK